MSFSTQEDVVNRALQHLGAVRIAALTDNSKNAAEMAFAYPLVRVRELRKRVWNFAVRRATLRPYTATTEYLSPAAYAAGTTYAAGAIVTANDAGGNSTYWISGQGSNTGNTPGGAGKGLFWQQYAGPVWGDVWSSVVSYNAGDLVIGTGGSTHMFVSLIDANLNNATSLGADWTDLGANSAILRPFLQPIAENTAGQTRKIYAFPYGYLRYAPQDNRARGTPTLNTSAGIQYTDWQREGAVFTSAANTGAIVFRFVADIWDVTAMDGIFCEAFAASLSVDTCDTLTQSVEKRKVVAALYDATVDMAGKINAIEAGSTEADEDSYFGPRNIDQAGLGSAGGGAAPQPAGR